MKPTPFLFICLFFQAVTPSLYAQWSKTQSPEGGTVEGFVRIGDTIIANAGRLYFSTDAGDHWHDLPADNGFHGGELRTDGRNLLMRSYVPELRTHKLFFSPDRGESWTAVPSPDSLHFFFFEISGPYIYGAYFNGIYRTADLGQHWEYWPSSISRIFVDESGLFVATHQYLFRVSDPGQPWDTLLQIGDRLQTLFINNDTLLAIHYDSTRVFHRSTDGGQHWEIMGQSVLPSRFFHFLSHGSTLYAIFPNCRDSSYRSHDWGQTWIPITQLDFCSDFIAGLASGDTLLTATRGHGILKSTDGGTNWTLANQGMRALQPENIRSIEGKLYSMQTDGLYRLKANGQDWSRLPISDSIVWPWPVLYFQDLAKTEAGFISLANNRLFHLNVQTSIWERIYDEERQELFYDHVFKINKVQGEVAGATSGEGTTLLMSRDQGQYFEVLYSNAGLPGGPEVIALTDSSCYVLQYGGRIFRSDDLGATWVALADVDLLSYFGFYNGSLDFLVAGDAFFIFNGFLEYASQMLYSPDQGATWIYYDLPAGERPWGAYLFTSLLEHQGSLFATTHNGIFVSQDNGLNWTPWNEGLEWLPARSLAIHDGFVWTGIHGDGIWKRPLADLNFLGEDQIARTKLEIWPNPATHTAQVLLSFPGELQVTDALGRIVYRKQSEQVSEFLPVLSWAPGLYRVTLRGPGDIISGSFIKN